MYNYDKHYIAKRASELGFIRDTLEKVYRLADVLEYLNTNPILKDSLALKGGTAINLTIFNLPRLSVDIDLDYLGDDSKDEMLINRITINSNISQFMLASGYLLSPKTKNPHSLDSWVYDYINTSGNKDNIKIEINYSMRTHILPAKEMSIVTEQFNSQYKIKCLSVVEIFGSKINALLSRAAARDLYDIYNMVRYNLFDKEEHELLRKCVVFYAVVSAKEINRNFATTAIDRITEYKIRTDLLPVITKKDTFDLDNAKKIVKEFIAGLMVLTEEEQEFIKRFENKVYVPELLFKDINITNRIKKHPMVLWKIQQMNRK